MVYIYILSYMIVLKAEKLLVLSTLQMEKFSHKYQKHQKEIWNVLLQQQRMLMDHGKEQVLLNVQLA